MKNNRPEIDEETRDGGGPRHSRFEDAVFHAAIALYSFVFALGLAMPAILGFDVLAFAFLAMVFLLTGMAFYYRKIGYLAVWGLRIAGIVLAVVAVRWFFEEERRDERQVVPTEEYSEYGDRFGLPDSWRMTGRSEIAEKIGRETETFLNPKDMPAIDGATSLMPLSLAVAFTVCGHNGMVNSSTTPVAYQNLIDGAADMIFTFAPSAEQEKQAKDAGKPFVFTPVGYDAFVFFVHEKNPVDDLTIEQLKAIYSGRARRWSDVGGPDLPIVAYQRAEGSGSQSRMQRFMAGDTLADPPKEWRLRTMSGIVRHVARYRNDDSAIGYSFLYFVENQVDSHGIKLLAIDGVAPSNDAVRERRYPLVDAIGVVTAGTKHPSVEPIIQWLLSPQGQRLVEKAGYVPLAIGEGGDSAAGTP